MKTKKFKHKIPIYYGELNIIFIDEIANLLNYYPKLKSECDGYDLQNFGALSIWKNNEGFHETYMVFDFKVKPDLIAHECLHITNRILKEAYVQVTYDNDEAQAYLLAWLVKKVHKSKNKLK